MSDCKCGKNVKIPKWAHLTSQNTKSRPASDFFDSLPKNKESSKRTA